MPTCTPPLYILYPATPTLSVEAFQESEAVEVVVPVTLRFAGTEGGVVSAATDTITCAVEEPLALIAVILYVVVDVGLTTSEPEKDDVVLKFKGEIDRDAAPVVDQESVDVVPAVIEVGFAANELMVGAGAVPLAALKVAIRALQFSLAFEVEVAA